MSQLARPRAVGKACSFRLFVKMERLGQRLGETAIGNNDGGDFSVIETQPLALQFQQRHTVALLCQYRRVLGRVDRDQRQATNLGQETTGEQLVRRRRPHHLAQFLAGHRHEQRVRPESRIVERGARALQVLVDQGKPHRQLANGSHSQAQHGLADRGHGPAAVCCRIAQPQQPARQGGIGLHHPRHLIESRLLAPAHLHYRQCHPLGAGQLATDPQLFDLAHVLPQLIADCSPSLSAQFICFSFQGIAAQTVMDSSVTPEDESPAVSRSPEPAPASLPVQRCGRIGASGKLHRTALSRESTVPAGDPDVPRTRNAAYAVGSICSAGMKGIRPFRKASRCNSTGA
jgi:hypothetical protein